MHAEGRGHADQDRVAFRETVVVRRRNGAAVSFERGRDARGTDVADVGLATGKRFGLLFVDVEADDGEAALCEEQHEREADVAEADHADGGGAIVDFFEKSLGHRAGRYQIESTSRRVDEL
jgi:hypothetical protein